MQYHDFCGERISALGMGNMRLPIEEQKGPIDKQRARAIIERAYEQGVNYFDTAYRYHKGESETFVGEVLGQYPRETWKLATKFPGHMMYYSDGKLGMQGYMEGENVTSVSEVFEDQLARCGVEFFDYYLLHNVSETSFDLYTNEELGVVDYLLEQKRRGRIKHLGFSTHGRADTIEAFLNWRDCFSFVQLQINYLDWDLQAAGRIYALLSARGISMIAMEPCRGGKLANLPAGVAALLEAARPGDTQASWAFRYLQALPDIKVVLSGMSTMAQLEENLALFSNPQPVDERERALLADVARRMVDLTACTACRYCCDVCPQKLDIPKLLSCYDQFKADGYGTLHFVMGALRDEEKPSACVACGACSGVCPQGIDIPTHLRTFARGLEEKKK